jgi:hypothetical protein
MPPRVSNQDRGKRRLPDLYGYNKVSVNGHTNYEINQDQAHVISTIFNRFIERDISINSLAIDLTNRITKTFKPQHSNIFSPAFVTKVLKRIEYCGYELVDDHLCECSVYPKIVDVDDWEIVQEMFRFKRTKVARLSKNRVEFPLSGFLKCQCGAKYYIKCKDRISSYYLHKAMNKKCSNMQLIKKNEISQIVDIVFLEMFTKKEYVTKLLRRYIIGTAISESHDDGQSKLRFLPTDGSVFPYLRFRSYLESMKDKLINGNISQREVDNRIIEYIDMCSDANEDFSKDFYRYMFDVLDNWLSKSKSDKFRILSDHFDNIVVRSNDLHFSLCSRTVINVPFPKLPAYWDDTVKKYKTVILTTPENKRQILLQEISEYIKKKTRALNHKQEGSLTEMATNFIANISKTAGVNSSVSLIQYYQPADYIVLTNTKQTINHLIIRKINGIFISNIDKESNQVIPIIFNNFILSFQQNNDIYFNQDYLHCLPEWFYGYHHEYFKTDIGKIAFIENENHIQAIKLTKSTTREKIDFKEAIDAIINSKKPEYVDID